MKSTDDLIRIVSFGGGIVIHASNKSTADLIRIASFAATKGSRVIMKNVDSKSTNDLVQIGSFGKGCVIFDLTE